MNRGTFIGRVGADAELKYTQSGKAVASFSMAIDNGKDREGEKRAPTWIKATLWEKRAESLAQYITKGKLVAVIGPVSVEAWIDKNDSSAKGKIIVTVNEFEFCGGGNKEEDSGESRPAQQQRSNSSREEELMRSTEITDEDIPF